jgi:O-antigen/teichoic acid export membrane protein
VQKKFITNIIIAIAINLAIKPIWIFGIDRNAQLLIGDAQYGLYAALMNLSIVFNIILDMGLTNLNNRLVAQNNNLLQENLVNISIAKLILFFVYMLALLVCGLVFGYNHQAMNILFLVAIIQFLNSFITFLRSNINANQLFKTDSFLGVADKLVMIVIFGFVFLNKTWQHVFNIHFFLYAQIASYLIAIAFALFFTKKIVTSSIRFSWQTLLPVIKQTIPYAILVLLMGLYMRSDLFILERCLPDGAYQSGMYAKSFRLLDSLNMIGFLFAGLLLPIFSKQISNKQSVLPLLKTSSLLLIPATVAVSVFCGFYAKEILELLYHYSDATLITSFRLVIAVFPAMAIMNIYSTLLASAAKIKELIIITAIAAAISMFCNYLAIGYFKNYLAVSIVGFIIQYTIAAAYMLGCKKEFGRLGLRKVLLDVGLSLGVFCMANALLHYYQVSLMWSVVANIILYTPILYFQGFFNYKILLKYLNNN